MAQLTPQTQRKTISKSFELYRDAGFALFPCRGFSKKPAKAGFNKIPHDANQTFDGDFNYGVNLEEKYLVIDVDKKNFAPDDRPLSRLWSDLSLTPQAKRTFTVETPSGGYHLYYRIPAGLLLRATARDYPGLEFKRHFIMAAGSYSETHERNYRIISGSPSEILPCPEILLAFLRRKDVLEGEDIDGASLDNGVDVSRYITFLCQCDPAVEGNNGDLTTFKTAAKGKEYGLSSNKTFELMAEHFNPRCSPPWSITDLENKVKNAFQYNDYPAGHASIVKEFPVNEKTPAAEVKKIFWDTKKDGSFKTTLHNTVQMLSIFDYSLLHNKIKFNLFSHKIEFIDSPPWHKPFTHWSDEDAIHIKHILSSKNAYDVPVTLIHEAAIVIASKKSYHPVRDFIKNQEWDGVKRIDTWLSDFCGAENNVYTRTIARKFLLGAISRVFKPGCQFDNVLVLEGAQGIGKSQLCRALAHPWFTDAPLDVHNKESVDILQGNWIIELAEMDAVSKFEARTLKGFITRQFDRCRPPYGRTVQDYPRQCVFIGTINPEHEGYLTDPTGNRRFWPVAIDHVDLLNLKLFRNQLWAEAYQVYTKGEGAYVEDKKTEEIITNEIKKRQFDDPWTTLIGEWVEKNTENLYHQKTHGIIVTLNEIFTSCLGAHSAQLTHREAIRIANALKQLGFSKSRKIIEGRQEYCYFRFIKEDVDFI